jgi:hypothetical protein
MPPMRYLSRFKKVDLTGFIPTIFYLIHYDGSQVVVDLLVSSSPPRVAILHPHSLKPEVYSVKWGG